MRGISHFFIHVAITGWVGIILAILMPIMKYSMAEQIYEDPTYDPIWLGGIALCLGAAGIILLGKKNKFRKAGLLYTLVGVISGFFYLVSYLKSE